MAPLEKSPSGPHWEDDRFAATDQVVRRWWVTIFLALMVMGWLVRGLSA
jgi:hypothetical protein